MRPTPSLASVFTSGAPVRIMMLTGSGDAAQIFSIKAGSIKPGTKKPLPPAAA